MAATEDGSMYFGGDSKRNSIKLRSPGILLEPHLMPEPTQTPWSSSEMVWSTPPGSYQRVMEFHAAGPSHFSQFNFKSSTKRKSNIETPIPMKQHITEEKMAEHLNGLHISSNYTSHANSNYLGKSTDSTRNRTKLDGFESMDSEMNASLDSDFSIMSQDLLKQKLRNAQRITVCEEIRQLGNEPLIPKALMERLERPCTALVLWRPPPQKLSDFIITQAQQQKRQNDDKDNNNCYLSVLNNGNSMDLDL